MGKIIDKSGLGGVIIVRDGAETIENAVLSLSAFCRQIVVVDTGSSDMTPVLSSRAGAELHFFGWTGSFSHARNYALKLMRTEWIISLDADEELEFDTFKNAVLPNDLTNFGGINVVLENYLGKDDTAPRSIHRYTRIFRNHSGIFYEGSIHEQINHNIEKSGFNIFESEIKIKHYGYMGNPQSKSHRNREMLLDELKAKPGDPWLKYHLAETEFSSQNLERASELFSDIVESHNLTDEQSEMSRIRLAQIALSKNNFLDVEKWLNFKSNDINREGFRQFVQAALLMIHSRFDEALKLYNSHEVRFSSLTDKQVIESAGKLLYEQLGRNK